MSDPRFDGHDGVRRPRSTDDRPERPRREGGERPERPFRPRKADDRPDRPRREGGERPDRPFRPRSESSDRPERPLKPRHEGGDRPEKPFRPRSESGDRPERSFKPRHEDGDRPERSLKPRHESGERPERPFRPRRDDQRRPRPRPAMDARKLALNALCDVTIGGAYSNIALNKRLTEVDISPEDRRLATNLFYTALENRMYIDHLLGGFIDHMPEEKIVREILHIAVSQLLYMDRVPDYAAVDAAVEQIKAYNRPQYAPMINGALRSLIRARDAGELKEPDRAANPVRYLSIMHSIPETMIRRLVDAYGEEQTEAIISYRPDTRWESVRPNLNELDDQAFDALVRAHGWQAEPGSVPHSVRLTGAGDLSGDPDYRKGLFSIQSESSMLAALAVGARPGMHILDACAAPGGKTALMAEQLHGSGRVYAWDVHAHRVELIKKTVERLRLYNVRPMESDASIPRPEFEARMDAVLLDVPCTGLGVIYGKPDLKYRLRDEKVEDITALQKRILNACAPYVKPGGTLVYSTCTFLREENADQVKAFLSEHPEFELCADGAWAPEAYRAQMDGGMLQILPHVNQGMEGFFIAVMRRKP